MLRTVLIGDVHIGENYHAEDISIPEADLAIILGDWVESGADDEYKQAATWVENNISCPVLIIRGNHDNGLWHRYARKLVPEGVRRQLENHSLSEKPCIFEWQPMIWQDYSGTIMNLPRESGWKNFPLPVQNRIIKLRDAAEGYYRYDAGDVLFLCLDTSNWLLGSKQIEWLKKQVVESAKPVIIVGHHHFLPVDIQFDTCQIHERDFIRRLVAENDSVIAFLHGHAHQDCWWRYSGRDIIGIRNRSSRVIQIENSGRPGFADTNGPIEAKIFFPDYLCVQDMSPGGTVWLSTETFSNPWRIAGTPCLGWLSGTEKDLQWSMRFPDKVPGESFSLVIQIANEGECLFEVTTPGSSVPAEKTISPAPKGQEIIFAFDGFEPGYYEIRLAATDGWGYVAMAASISTGS